MAMNAVFLNSLISDSTSVTGVDGHWSEGGSLVLNSTGGDLLARSVSGLL